MTTIVYVTTGAWGTGTGAPNSAAQVATREDAREDESLRPAEGTPSKWLSLRARVPKLPIAGPWRQRGRRQGTARLVV